MSNAYDYDLRCKVISAIERYNTLMIQQELADLAWMQKMGPDELWLLKSSVYS